MSLELLKQVGQMLFNLVRCPVFSERAEIGIRSTAFDKYTKNIISIIVRLSLPRLMSETQLISISAESQGGLTCPDSTR